MGNKFKIDPVPMTGNRIGNDAHAIAFPAVDTITTLLFFFIRTCNAIFFDGTIQTILGINTKKSILKNIICDYHIVTLVNFYGSNVFNTGYTRVYYFKSLYGNTGRFDRYIFVFVFTIQYRVTNTYQYGWFVDDQVFFMVNATGYFYSITAGRLLQGFADGRIGFIFAYCKYPGFCGIEKTKEQQYAN